MLINKKIIKEAQKLAVTDETLSQEISERSDMYENNLDFFNSMIMAKYPEHEFTPNEEFSNYYSYTEFLESNSSVYYLKKDSFLAEALSEYAKSLGMEVEDLINGAVNAYDFNGFYTVVAYTEPGNVNFATGYLDDFANTFLGNAPTSDNRIDNFLAFLN